MASFGKLNVAAFHGTQELALALAHINFDFSLVKVEAPAEYAGVGAALTSNRRHIAESGSQHITARKLGALFESVLPPTPRLIEAYGKRASEVAKRSAEKEGQPLRKEEAGAFAEFAGPDATSIWAAATSGNAAVAVHLLACMLARVWTPAQATSIWVELVEARKKHIETETNGDVNFPLFLAGQCQITREQLAEWDNSARAWLRRADQVKKVQQTQLMLICNNLNLPVSLKLDVYQNVITGWTTSLRGLEDLLAGLPQRVQDGSLLLALSSWHLYPDIMVLGHKPVKQHDHLVPAVAELILNMENSPALEGKGVYWCLSLSRLRFYGDPAMCEQSLNIESSRLSIDQVSAVALGSVIGGWGVFGRNIVSSCHLVRLLSDYAFGTDAPRSGNLVHPRWLRMLAEAATAVKSANSSERDINLRLVKLGRGAGASFLSRPEKHPPYLFGLARVAALLNLLSEPIHCVMLLIKAARAHFLGRPPPGSQGIRVPPTMRDLIIRYPLTKDSDPQDAKSHGYITVVPSEEGVLFNWTSDKSTALELGNHPWLPRGVKLTVEWHPLPKSFTGFRRIGSTWSYAPTDSLFDIALKKHPVETEEEEEEKEKECGKEVEVMNEGKKELQNDRDEDDIGERQPKRRRIHWKPNMEPEDSGDKNGKTDEAALAYGQYRSTSILPEFADDSDGEAEEHSTQGPVPSVTIQVHEPEDKGTAADSNSLEDGQDKESDGLWKPVMVYEMLKVPSRSATLFYSGSLPSSDTFEMVCAPTDAVEQALTNKWIDASKLQQAIDGAMYWAGTAGYSDYATSLVALGFMEKIYNTLGDATISPAIVGSPLGSAKWLGIGESHTYKELYKHPDMEMQREEAFACICYMETGLDISPDIFRKVVAMSSGDSIFVAGGLLCDPLEFQCKSLVKRLIGNFGKPGVTLLVPPPNPLCREPNPEDWQVINHDPYDGRRLEDAFGGTTLHLSFTGWRMQVDSSRNGNDRGIVDKEVEMYEALVSAHERGKWIADLDALTALAKSSATHTHDFYYKSGCRHGPEARTTGEATSTSSSNMKAGGGQFDVNEDHIVTVASWEEFLDFLHKPNGPALTLSYRNWMARLAIVSLAVMKGMKVFINDGFCFHCYEEIKGQWALDTLEKTLFIC